MIPNDLGDDSSPRSFGIARGAGGAAARRERLSYRGSFSMTLGMSLALVAAIPSFSSKSPNNIVISVG